MRTHINGESYSCISGIIRHHCQTGMDEFLQYVGVKNVRTFHSKTPKGNNQYINKPHYMCLNPMNEEQLLFVPCDQCSVHSEMKLLTEEDLKTAI